jgi:hypothetical protein
VNAAAEAYILAARCPPTIPTGEFGLWKIEREDVAKAIAAVNPWMTRARAKEAAAAAAGFANMTILSRWTEATLHLGRGDIVMEDSRRELGRHLPIWMNASGRVLITGLGLGCVVRGLLTNPAVEHITVVELDSHIIKAVWPEFANDERLTLAPGDAFEIEWPADARWDWAWHDIYHEAKHEAVLHGDLMIRYQDRCARQGAWGMPRWFWRRVGRPFL